MTLVDKIADFNEKFDYGEYHHDPDFWIAALRHQTDEMDEALAEGDLNHVAHEAADAVLIAFQIMSIFGDASPRTHVRHRIGTAERRGIQDQIVPKYIEWYERRDDD